MKKSISLLLALIMLAVMAFGMVSTASAATKPIDITVIGTQYPHFVQQIKEQWKKVAINSGVGYVWNEATRTFDKVETYDVEGLEQVKGNEGAWIEAEFRVYKHTNAKVEIKYGRWYYDEQKGYFVRAYWINEIAPVIKADQVKIGLSYKQFGNLIILVNKLGLYIDDYLKNKDTYVPGEGYSLIIADSNKGNFSVSDAEFEELVDTAPIFGWNVVVDGKVYNKNDVEIATFTAKKAWLPIVLEGNYTGNLTTSTGLVWQNNVPDFAIDGQFRSFSDAPFADVQPSGARYINWTIKAIEADRLNEVEWMKALALKDMVVGEVLTIYSNKLFVRFDTQVAGTTANALNVSAGKVTVEKVDKNFNSFFLLIPYRDMLLDSTWFNLNGLITSKDGVIVKFAPHGITEDTVGFYRFIAFEGAETIVPGTVAITAKKATSDTQAYTLTSTAGVIDIKATNYTPASTQSFGIMLYGTAAGMTRDLGFTSAVYDKEVTVYREVITCNAAEVFTFPAFVGTRTYNVVTWNGGGWWSTGYVCVNDLTINANTGVAKFDIGPAKDLRVQGTDTLVWNNTAGAKVSDYVSFESANPNVLTVDAEGNVKGVSKGTTWVYVNVKKNWNGNVYSDLLNGKLNTVATVWNAGTVYHIQVTVNDKAAIYMTNATIVGTAAKIYKLPSLNSDVIGTIGVGTIIDYKSDAEVVNGFLKVVNNNADAYILMSQISFLVQSDNPAGSNAGVEMTVTTKGGTLNVRSAPGGAVVGKLANGTKIVVVDTTNSAWYKLSDGNFVSASYVK